MRICEGAYWIVSGHPNLLTQFLLCHAYEERKSIGEDVKGSCEGSDVKSGKVVSDVEGSCEGSDVKGSCEGSDVEGSCDVGDVERGSTTRDVKRSKKVRDVKDSNSTRDVKEGNTTRDVEKDEGKIHTAKIIEVSRLAPLPPDRIPAKVVNEDIVDKNHPNLLFRYEGNMYSVYCGLLKTGRDLRKAIWRVVMVGRNDA